MSRVIFHSNFSTPLTSRKIYCTEMHTFKAGSLLDSSLLFEGRAFHNFELRILLPLLGKRNGAARFYHQLDYFSPRTRRRRLFFALFIYFSLILSMRACRPKIVAQDLRLIRRRRFTKCKNTGIMRSLLFSRALRIFPSI